VASYSNIAFSDVGEGAEGGTESQQRRGRKEEW